MAIPVAGKVEERDRHASLAMTGQGSPAVRAPTEFSTRCLYRRGRDLSANVRPRCGLPRNVLQGASIVGAETSRRMFARRAGSHESVTDRSQTTLNVPGNSGCMTCQFPGPNRVIAKEQRDCGNPGGR